MTDNETPLPSGIPDAAFKQKKSSRISAVWIIPVIAALIGGWLVFQEAAEDKTVVEVAFESAEGIEAGKTVVKLRNIKIGTVTDVQFSTDLTSVIVVMEFPGVAQAQITDSTRFWVVRPRIAISGVSGLDTLLSGAYIEIDPGNDGEPASHFIGLEQPEIYQRGNPGTKYILSSTELGSLSRGSPVKFRGIPVGVVTRYQLVDDHSRVDIEIFIEAPHDQFVKANTRFWNITGLEVELSAEGIELNMDSVATLMAGGIAFSTKDNSAALASEKKVFVLHQTANPEIEEKLTFGVPVKFYFDKGVKGLSVGAPVEFKGLRLGTVSYIGIETNKSYTDLFTYAMVNIEPQRLPKRIDYGVKKDQRLEVTHKFFESMVDKGMRARLVTGNLLTGKSLIALDMFPEMKKGKVRYVDGLIIVPTAPHTLADILEKVDAVMTRIKAMPLEEIGNNIEQTTASINSLVKSLNAAEGGMMGVQITETIEELSRAARALRAMAEYLERHPEALISGKSDE